jgi:hypothetical protein
MTKAVERIGSWWIMCMGPVGSCRAHTREAIYRMMMKRRTRIRWLRHIHETFQILFKSLDCIWLSVFLVGWCCCTHVCSYVVLNVAK